MDALGEYWIESQKIGTENSVRSVLAIIGCCVKKVRCPNFSHWPAAKESASMGAVAICLGDRHGVDRILFASCGTAMCVG
jgi:hypothetical protein